MIINLMNDNYLKNENLYSDFLDDTIKDKYVYKSSVNVTLNDIEPFPIYAGVYTSSSDKDFKKDLMFEALKVIDKYYLKLDRELILNQNFWHSLFLITYRDYIIDLYPEILTSESKFKSIVLKKFDWENYIYKVVIGAQYIEDNVLEVNKEKYYNLILDNLDLYNYIIKYHIFRNDKFLMYVLNIISEYDELSAILKAKIKDRDDLGEDERYGRRVIFELNKSYPVSMSPLMSYEDFKAMFFYHLKKYYPMVDQII